MEGATDGLTARQRITLREYGPGHVTQAQLGAEFGVSQSAIAWRLKRARERQGLGPRPRAMRRLRTRLTSLSLVHH
jgi:DNA-directed RNA polymerase specialized sigma24 family protein